MLKLLSRLYPILKKEEGGGIDFCVEMVVSVFLNKNQESIISNRATNKTNRSSLISKMRKEAGAAVGWGEFLSSSPYRRFLYYLSWIPAATILLLMLVFLWSSSTTILSGSYVHVCISPSTSGAVRNKLIINNLYCLPPASSNAAAGLTQEEIISSNSSINNTTSPIEEILAVNPPDDHVVWNITEDDQSRGINTTTSTTSDSSSSSNTASDFIYKKDDEFVFAVKVVEELLQVHRSWRLSTPASSNSKGTTTRGTAASCDGRGIFVYDLPSKFNKDLMRNEICSDMVPWMDFCEYFTNEAMGQPIPKLGKGWYKTHQYSLEPLFHARVLKHPCRVYNENEAKLFYVPYYGGLDILRWNFKNATDHVKDMLSLELMEWLQEHQSWVKNSGKDHVFVLGKISWDFRRRVNDPWGTRFLELEQMQNPLKLLIERQPWHANDIGVPHPTLFHPHSDTDITEWQSKIIGSSRKSLISFAGAARPGASDNIRSLLIQQCISRDDEKCRFLNCKSGGCDQPETVIELFLESEFCLQPPGDSPTRKSVFDSLISGCIPVLFDPFTAYYQYAWHLPEDYKRYSVYIAKEEVRDMKVDAVERLMKVSLQEREDMRRYIVYELMPRLVYGEPNSQLDKFEDAFSVSINNLLDRVTNLD